MTHDAATLDGRWVGPVIALKTGRSIGFIGALYEKRLLASGYEWTQKDPLTSYLAPSTWSHYHWAIRQIRRWGGREQLRYHSFTDREKE
jgi:hypothetical protein